MISLEISPNIFETSSNTLLGIQTQAEDNRWEKTILQNASGDVLGWAEQKQNPQHLVRFFQGKGGYCVVVSNDELTYFGLPGSQIMLSDTNVELHGDFISGKPKELIFSQTKTPTQSITDQAMILGAGLATRFEPISGDTTGFSKPGVPLVGDDSVIVTIAKHLRKHGFRKILVNTFYKPQSLKQQLQDVSGIEIQYIDEEAPSGTAGGLAKALKQSFVDPQKPIFIIQGDAITDANLSFLMQTHQDRNAAVTIGGQIVRDEDVNKFGIIKTDGSGGDGQSGNILSFKEKPALKDAGRSRFGNAGFYILAPEIFSFFSALCEKKGDGRLYDYAQDFFPAVLEAVHSKTITNWSSGDPMCFWAQAVGGYWSDMGNPTQYIEAVRDIYAGHLDIELPDNLQAYYENNVIYWPGSKRLVQNGETKLNGNIIVALNQDF